MFSRTKSSDIVVKPLIIVHFAIVKQNVTQEHANNYQAVESFELIQVVHDKYSCAKGLRICVRCKLQKTMLW